METYSERILKGGGLVAWQRFARFRAAAAALRRQTGGAILCDLLDIGAADGIGLPYLKPLAKRVLSVNYYEEHTQEFRRAHPDDEVITADARNLPLPPRSFDAVVSFETLHLLPGPDERRKCLAEIGRVLRPGGLLVCSVPIEVGYPALLKLVARACTGHRLEGMDLRMALKHWCYRFFPVESYDRGRQVGFNVYGFVSQIGEALEVLQTRSIPVPVLFPTNLLIVARKRE